MCEGSIHVAHRNATDKEHLVIMKVPGLRMKGYYPVDRNYSDDRLVCVRGDCKAVIKQVRFEPGLPANLIGRWERQRDVEVWLHHASYFDAVIFPDGMSCMLSGIADGVRIDIGYPVHAQAMKVVEASIVEALALPPDPKPEGEADAPASEPPAEPAPEPAPAREPESSLMGTVRNVFVRTFSS